ncbi:MAG: hypothetical protein H6673_15680 [Anaerolineales bacterium]|nr:hypothetical protein [Anaerolineales bacterium]
MGGNLSQHDAAGAWHWALVDGVGSVRGMVDEAFVVEGSRGFAPYGLPYSIGGRPVL